MEQARQQRRELRGAVYRTDVPVLTELLAADDLSDRLQLAGAGALALLRENAEAREPATRVSAALRGRAWVGDEELAEEIDATLAGVRRALRRVPVDLGRLADLFVDEGADVEGAMLDLASGDVWPVIPPDDEDDAGQYAAGQYDAGQDDPDVDGGDRWLAVPVPERQDAWRDMSDFAGTVAPALRARLLDAIDGRGAFSRFRRELDRADIEVVDAWLAFREERRLGRARAWLAGEGYVPA